MNVLRCRLLTVLHEQDMHDHDDMEELRGMKDMRRRMG